MVFTKHIQRGLVAAMVVCRTHAGGGAKGIEGRSFHVPRGPS